MFARVALVLLEEDEIRIGISGLLQESTENSSVFAAHRMRTLLKDIAVLSREPPKLMS